LNPLTLGLGNATGCSVWYNNFKFRNRPNLTISLKRLYIINEQNENKVKVELEPNKVCSVSNCMKPVYEEMTNCLYKAHIQLNENRAVI